MFKNCERVYASIVALNLHIKLKHHGGNKTQREKLAVKMKLLLSNYSD